MRRTVKWIAGIVIAAAIIVGLSFVFIEGRDEIAREREREAPIKIAPRISRTSEGDIVVTIDRETQQRMGLVGICADRVYPSPRGIEFGSGALTMMLAYAADVTPVFTGKPERVFFARPGATGQPLESPSPTGFRSGQ